MFYRKTKKKFLAVVTAVVLALGCALPVFAAPSYDASIMDRCFSMSSFGIATTAVGDYRVQVSQVDTSKVGIAGITSSDDPSVKAILFTNLRKTAGVSGSRILSIFDCKYKDLDEDLGTEICFFVDGVKNTDSITVWHWDTTALKWENSSCKVTKVEYNHVYAKVKKLSPLAFVKVGSTTATTGASASVAPDTVYRDVQESNAVDAIKNTTVATTFAVEMSSTNTNTDVIKEAIANTNVKRLVMNITASIGHITWSINRENFTSASDVAQINLDVKHPDTEVPAATVNTVAKNNEPTQQIELAHDGAFKGFSRAQLSMTAPAGVKAGTYANLFYYNNGALTLESVGEINASLRFTIAFRHASKYVIVYGKNMLANEDSKYDPELMADAFDMSKVGVANVATVSGDYKVKVGPVTLDKIGFKQDAINLTEVMGILYDDLKKTSKCNKIISIFEASYPDLDEDNGTELVFYIDGIKKDDNIVMWHWDNKELRWENTSCKVTKVDYNHVWAKVKKLSPIAFVKGGAAAGTSGSSGSSGNSSTKGTSTKQAPKTGEV